MGMYKNLRLKRNISQNCAYLALFRGLKEPKREKQNPKIAKNVKWTPKSSLLSKSLFDVTIIAATRSCFASNNKNKQKRKRNNKEKRKAKEKKKKKNESKR